MKRPAAKVSLVVISLALSLIGAEWLVRALSIGPDLFSLQRGMVRLSPDPRLRYELVPQYISPRMDVLINAWGMRDGPVDLKKPSGSRRMACIGDSIAFGMGAGQDDHFGPHLETAVQVRMPDRPVEVLNFGVPGYNLDQIAAVLDQRVGVFDPDAVLYLFCLNDVQETSRELESLLRDGKRGEARRDYVQRVWDASESVLGGSKLWRLTRYFIASWRADSSVSVDPYRDAMDRLLVGEGDAFVQTLYQHPESSRRLEAGFRAMADWQGENDVPVWVVIFPVFSNLDDYPFSSIHENVRVTAESQGLKVIDLLNDFRRASRENSEIPLHADPLHPNAAGYARAAGQVETVLREVWP